MEYKYASENQREDLFQLYRRINQYIVVNSNIISIYENGVDKYGLPVQPGFPIMNDLIQNIKKEKKKTDIKSVLQKLNEKE